MVGRRASTGMRVGGERFLIIPPHLALWGRRDSADVIPPNSILLIRGGVAGREKVALVFGAEEHPSGAG